MPIRINLIEDDELRKEIRDMIKGQFKNLIREEVKKQIAEQVGETIESSLTADNVKHLIYDHVRNHWSFHKEVIATATQLFNDQYTEKIDKYLNDISIEKLTKELLAYKIGNIISGREVK